MYQNIWDKKLTEESKVVALKKVTIDGVAKEIMRINTSMKMAVVATMMEVVLDTKIKLEDGKLLQAYDALVFYVVQKGPQMQGGGNVFVPQPAATPVAPAPTVAKPAVQVDLS